MLLSLLVFFRDTLLSGLTLVYGDSYDGLIETAILDHWYAVVANGARWDVTGYFYPYPATLGYNDTYIVPGIAFTLARLAGADPFLATLASHVAMKALGFAGMYVLLRRGLGVRTALAVAGAALFATANASLLHMHHAQLLAVGLLPWLGFLAVRTYEAVLGERARNVLGYGGGFALLYGVSALNGFYGLWFFTLFVLLLTPIGLIAMGRGTRRALATGLGRHWRVLVAVACIGAVALVPCLILYLPKVSAGARHGWADGPHLYLPNLATILNVGRGNLMWGDLPSHLAPGASFRRGEDQFGVPVGLMLATMFATIWGARNGKDGRLVLALGATLGAMLMLTFRWPGDHSLWWFVYRVVPGADAVRVVARFGVFALVPIVALVIVYLDRAARPALATIGIVGFLLVEEVQLRAPLAIDRSRQLRLLAAVGTPPAGCEAFFIVAMRDGDLSAEARRINAAWGGTGLDDGDRRRYPHNVDAMLIAGETGRPTINGYSSFNPPDWDFADPQAADYFDRVRRYAARHGIRRLCGYDRGRTPGWFEFNPRPAPAG